MVTRHTVPYVQLVLYVLFSLVFLSVDCVGDLVAPAEASAKAEAHFIFHLSSFIIHHSSFIIPRPCKNRRGMV